jgi:hypothetical protein
MNWRFESGGRVPAFEAQSSNPSPTKKTKNSFDSSSTIVMPLELEDQAHFICIHLSLLFWH